MDVCEKATKRRKSCLKVEKGDPPPEKARESPLPLPPPLEAREEEEKGEKEKFKNSQFPPNVADEEEVGEGEMEKGEREKGVWRGQKRGRDRGKVTRIPKWIPPTLFLGSGLFHYSPIRGGGKSSEEKEAKDQLKEASEKFPARETKFLARLCMAVFSFSSSNQNLGLKNNPINPPFLLYFLERESVNSLNVLLFFIAFFVGIITFTFSGQMRSSILSPAPYIPIA